MTGKQQHDSLRLECQICGLSYVILLLDELMRYDEELCKDAFDSLLRENGLEAHWLDGREPPDWFLDIGGKRIAVEVTSIHGHTNLGDASRSWTGLSKELLAFGAGVCKEVESRISIPGLFLIPFLSTPMLKKLRKKLVTALVAYFEKDALLVDTMTPQIVLYAEGRKISVWKVNEEGCALVAQALPTGGFITSQDDQLRNLLASTIKKKAEKLKMVDKPMILIILDLYGFQRSIEEWRTRLPHETSCFEALVRVQGKDAELISGTLCVK